MTCSHVDSPLLPQLFWMPHRFPERKLLSNPGSFNFSRAYMFVLCSAVKAILHQLESITIVPLC